jgi:hypothetical protein
MKSAYGRQVPRADYELTVLREQIRRIEDGQDPINVVREPDANHRIPTNAWNTILSPAEAAQDHGDGV